nr:HAMP domain-containing sensor histidine kinase [uncultured Methanospirillum sp.]
MSSGSLSGAEQEEVLNRTLESKESFVIDRSDQKQIISVQYINLSTTRSTSGAERSYVGVLVFSTDPTEQLIQLYRAGFMLITIIALLLSLIAARHLSVYISRPIEMMTEDVGIIASSSLSHQVRETGVHETEKLRRSINSLVASIKDYIAEIENQQQELRTELQLRVKAENALEKANKRLMQLSQITRHDILNQITALQIFLEIIPETTDKKRTDEYTGKAQKVLSSITTLLSFTYDYEQIGQDGPAWQNIGNILDDLQDEFSDQIQIKHSCSTIEILADRLIKKVFYNLIDNTIRHGSASTVTVSFEERDSGYLLYQDGGYGIVESDKERIFSRGYGRGTGIGMAFIREVLESDDITIRENGVAGKGARFEIMVPPDHYRITET